MSLRADAARNRATLLETARDAFAAGEGDVTFDALARRAGVGVGTLYRNFPTRQDLVEAVYHSELDEVVALAEALLREHRADVALRHWIDRYATFFATKHGMAEAFQQAVASGVIAGTDTRARIHGVLGAFLAAGAADGTLRADVDAGVATSIILGSFLATAGVGVEGQRGRVLDVVVDGLRPR
ncbi:TetR/AcrR family transcriptional regulator [Curtobacterium sp. Leaf261]|uniref:TetR/AcrR family transcriptional regulator n=1 Tax=Curtobacterium sp. Leaf261 TaxID=1736311 RepID=UPI000700B162|nr:TetR/AcrR family transcriptional regulator [Curtobacterium sp. Leaf261]KQO64415.1 TetR family transcriptional regulator [Curtobacterium sp. Leaf261]